MSEVITEQFTYNGEDILQLKQDFIENTLSCYFLINGMKTALVPESLGDRFININTTGITIPLRVSISITYRIEKDISKYSIGERLKILERKVETQEQELKVLREALKHRVDITVFKTYLRSLEKKLNVDLIDNQFPLPYP